MRRIWRIPIGCAALLLCLPAPPRARAADEVAVVVNKGNDVNGMSLELARKFFLGDKSVWPNGRRVTVLMSASGSPEREAALHSIYKMSESEYAKYFLQAAFTGRVQTPPKDVSATEVKKMVADNPGAIGCIRKDQVDDSVKVALILP